MMPKTGQAMVIFGNTSTAPETITFNNQPINVAVHSAPVKGFCAGAQRPVLRFAALWSIRRALHRAPGAVAGVTAGAPTAAAG
jgi:hypothetical protein